MKEYIEIRRGKPAEEIIFKNPIISKGGIQLLSYNWSWCLEEILDSRGEEIVRRVSDWNGAIDNIETGREIVHQFKIKLLDEKIEYVSLESAIKILGEENIKEIKQVASQVKALVKNKLKLFILQGELDQVVKAENDVNKLIPPEITVSQRNSGSFEWRMSDAFVWQQELGSITQERYETLLSAWRAKELQKRGINFYESSTIRNSIASLKKVITRQENKRR